jgi:protoheme IX farnesyltransferase
MSPRRGPRSVRLKPDATSKGGAAMKESAANPAPVPVTVPVPTVVGRRRGADFFQLAKPRLNLLVIVTTCIGYYMGAVGEATSLALLFNTLMGTALVAGGSGAFNQLLERDADGLMRRTRGRPLPDGRLQPADAWWFAFALSIGGIAQLAIGANLVAAVIALLTLVSYLFVYTPMKRRSPFSTLVGGFPGALPPLIGWAAARGTLSLEAWSLFGIVFLWQMPHFLAIGWLYRDDYRAAGFRVLPVLEPDGAKTGAHALFYSLGLVPVSLLPIAFDLAGSWYLATALALGAGFVALAARFARHRTTESARGLFLGSLAYLPMLWTVMLIDRTGT